jgi:DNA polymerase I
MHLDDPASHVEMIERLESRYKVEECSFRTIYGIHHGYKVFASRKVAERIEKQTHYEARFYNVDVRQDQKYKAGMTSFHA